jgi:hypothetical protein
MAARQLSASALIAAPAQDIYAIIADYRGGHLEIIPRPPFVSVEVLEGGAGAGTVIRVKLKLFGKVQTYNATVSEPEPGRVLAETNDNGYVTSFIVEPREGGKQAYVTISTKLSGRGGLLGALEHWLLNRTLRPVYLKELEQLAAVAGARTA